MAGLRDDLLALRAQLDAIIGRVGPSGSAPIRSDVDPDPGAPRPFIGKPLSSKFPGKCCVCGQLFERGERIVYADKRTAHLGCGQAG